MKKLEKLQEAERIITASREGGKMENVNNNVNQEIKRQFVDREIKACFSYEMEAVLNASAEGAKDLPDIESIENF